MGAVGRGKNLENPWGSAKFMEKPRVLITRLMKSLRGTLNLLPTVQGF